MFILHLGESVFGARIILMSRAIPSLGNMLEFVIVT